MIRTDGPIGSVDPLPLVDVNFNLSDRQRNRWSAGTEIFSCGQAEDATKIPSVITRRVVVD